MNVASIASTLNSGGANVAQGYCGYASYPNIDPYGYNGSGYPGYYSGYQQQPNQYQQQSNQYQQQSNQSYPQPIGAYQNTDFWKLYKWCLRCSDQLVAWQAQHYKQWSEYYNQSHTDVSCAPGTENLSVTSASNLSCSVPTYSASNYQLPAPNTPSWRQESSSSESTPLQLGVVSGSINEGYWKQGTPALQDNYSNSQLPHVQKPLDANPTYGSFQNQQQSIFAHGSSTKYPPSQPVSQSSFQTVSQPLDSHMVNKLLIPTNPRITSNLVLGSPKTDKESTTASTDSKPAYVGVSMPKPNEKASSHDAADSVLKPGVFPNSLRGYVERAFARCKDDMQKAACQATMKEVYTLVNEKLTCT
ncbi:Hypothetical predicted protein [Olea europaea subsp. europaea]|uniref:Uncharacterized protein n=1 Tax=Olea europaea subsp. europaea TaxID=158383 RepID=A0A8S0UDU2_OLEEU|nr:Hypothetical predicted protein [Olea europaea subsp. europaea]